MTPRRVRASVAAFLLTAMLLPLVPATSAENPSVSIDFPPPGAELQGSILVNGHTSTDVTHVQLRVDDGAWTFVDQFSGDSWLHSLDTTLYPNGPHTIEVRARSAGGVFDHAFRNITILNPLIYDFTVAAFSAEGITGNPVLTVTAANAGATDASDIVATFDYMDHFEWIGIGSTTFDIAGEDETTFTLTWEAELLFGEFPVRVTLDAGNAYPEQDESNNGGETIATFYVPVLEGTDPLYPLQDDPVPSNAKVIAVRGTGATSVYDLPVHVVRVRDQVVWVNYDESNVVLHSAVADDGSFDTGLIERGWHSPIYTFDEAATYTYHCSVHPQTMKGLLVVVGNDI